MPDAHIGTIHKDAWLTNLAIVYRNDELIYDQAIPALSVKQETDKYLTYDKSGMQLVEDKWADGTVAKEVQYRTSEATYSTTRHGLKAFVSDRKVQRSDSPLRPMITAQNNLLDRIKLRQEYKAATLLTTEGNNGGHMDVGGVGHAHWDDLSNSDPIADVATGIEEIHGKTGKKANTLVIPFDIYMILKQHPDILDRIKYTQKGIVTADLLGSIFEVEKVLIAGALINTAKEGQADSLSYLWGNNVWLGYQDKVPSLECLTHSINFTAQKLQTERWRDNERKGTVIRVSKEDDAQVVCADCGYLFLTVLT